MSGDVPTERDCGNRPGSIAFGTCLAHRDHASRSQLSRALPALCRHDRSEDTLVARDTPTAGSPRREYRGRARSCASFGDLDAPPAHRAGELLVVTLGLIGVGE